MELNRAPVQIAHSLARLIQLRRRQAKIDRVLELKIERDHVAAMWLKTEETLEE